MESDDDGEQLQHLVEVLHSCRATFVQSVPVREKFRGKLAWDGIVHIFAIQDNPDVKRAMLGIYRSKAARCAGSLPFYTRV